MTDLYPEILRLFRAAPHCVRGVLLPYFTDANDNKNIIPFEVLVEIAVFSCPILKYALPNGSFHVAGRRIALEVLIIERSSKSTGISLIPDETDVSKFVAVIDLTTSLFAPPECPYYGGTFYLNVELCPDYPSSPPRIRFRTKIYHPNINDEGCVGASILAERFTPAITISFVLHFIKNLLLPRTSTIRCVL